MTRSTSERLMHEASAFVKITCYCICVYSRFCSAISYITDLAFWLILVVLIFDHLVTIIFAFMHHSEQQKYAYL